MYERVLHLEQNTVVKNDLKKWDGHVFKVKNFKADMVFGH